MGVLTYPLHFTYSLVTRGSHNEEIDKVILSYRTETGI